MSVTIGKEFKREIPGGFASVIPLPHPSGASPWAHMPGNREKLAKALRLIKTRLKRQGIEEWFLEPTAR